MKYLESLRVGFDKPSQANLINRIIIRLRREDSCLFPKRKYESEEDLDERIPISRDKFMFSDWTQLREEMETLVIQHSNQPKLLESLLIRYMQPFDFAASILFSERAHSEYDLTTAAILKEMSDTQSFVSDNSAQGVRFDLIEYYHRAEVTPISDELIDGLQQDLVQLHRLISSMNFVAEIIQGLLFEISAPFTLQTLQNDCGIILTDSLMAWKMAPLMGWTTDYCRRLMGNRILIVLDREPIDTISLPGQAVTDDEILSKPKRTEVITTDKLISLCQVLKGDYTKLQEDDTWVFTGPANLYAYMGYRMAIVCGLTQIPWQRLMRILRVKGDSNYLKGEASTLKKTRNYPQGYVVIDDAITQVFK